MVLSYRPSDVLIKILIEVEGAYHFHEYSTAAAMQDRLISCDGIVKTVVDGSGSRDVFVRHKTTIPWRLKLYPLWTSSVYGHSIMISVLGESARWATQGQLGKLGDNHYPHGIVAQWTLPQYY